MYVAAELHFHIVAGATKARLALMNHRISHGINKVTANKWESIWADALPIGNGRCNKKRRGPRHLFSLPITHRNKRKGNHKTRPSRLPNHEKDPKLRISGCNYSVITL